MKTLKTTILIAIIFTALVLRLLPIKWGLPSKNLAITTYNPDESGSYNTIEKWKPKELKFPLAKPTLHWGNLHLFTLASVLKLSEIFGYIKVGNREFYLNDLREADKLYIVGRLISIISGTLSILLLFFVTKLAFNNELIAFLSALILTILPMHLINSLYVRPDILMMFFGLFVIYFSLKIIDNGRMKYYFLAGIFLGLTTATKYSGGSYFILPVIAHLIKSDWGIFKKQTYLNKSLWIMFFITIVTFVISCPYSVLYISIFIAEVKDLVSQASGVTGFVDTPAWWRYLTWYLPYGMGIPLLVFSVAGLLKMTFSKSNKKNNQLLTISGIIVFILITRSNFQLVWHTIPFVPFSVIYSGYFLYSLWISHNLKVKVIGITFIFLTFIFTGIYSFAYEGLFLKKNVREEASEWIDQNIPKGTTIGIAKSFFWTPAILRQYNPPYKLLMGGDIHSVLNEAVLGLKNVSKEADYLVLTECEYRNYIHPKIQKNFPEQSKIIKEIMYGNKFTKIAEFDKEAKFLWFTFKKNYPPDDWLIVNPKIIIFKKNEKNFL